MKKLLIGERICISQNILPAAEHHKSAIMQEQEPFLTRVQFVQIATKASVVVSYENFGEL